MPTVHSASDYEPEFKAPPPPGYPTDRVLDPFRERPNGSTFEQRRQQFLAHCVANPAPRNTKTAWYELARLAGGGVPYEGAIHAALDYIAARKDCADFTLHGILRLLYQFERHEHVSAALAERARRVVLDFKYWPDEPGIDSMCTWTENHYILFTSAAYLAGQRYPLETFANSGQSGQEKMTANRPRILRWLDLRFRTGFSEWLSHVYYDEDLAALLSLADFCHDPEIRRRSVMVIDVLLLDLALNSHRGVFGSTHGRAYENTKKRASNEGTTDTSRLLFGVGQYGAFDNMSAIAFALSPTYRLPPAIAAVAGDERPEMLNRQRMGLRVAEAERWGLGFASFEDGMAWLTLEAYLHPRTASLTLRLFDAFNWWENSFFAPFKRYRGLISLLRRTPAFGLLTRVLEWDLCRNTREVVDILTYRTPDYMLSCAQDYRPGYGGDQQHVWQATLGPDAVCFTTHPARLAGASPNYWAGCGVLPRAAQVKNVVIVVYNTHTRPALYDSGRLPFTHAWLPRDRFDEVAERGGWIFARREDGYLALRSWRPYRWQDAPGEDQGREIIASGRSNIWICELGRRAVDGDFAAFMHRIAGAALRFAGLAVTYDSPSQGRLEFGWRGPLRQNGTVVALHAFPRYDNPYALAAFPAGRVALAAGGHALELDWSEMQRTDDGASFA